MPAINMERVTVAVVGTGPSGLSMLKTLREDGFSVTAFERRSRVGGIWAVADNSSYTTTLPCTRANISKYTCGFSDYPIPERYPMFMKAEHFQEFMNDYAKDFDLHQHIVFNCTVKSVRRNDGDTKWCVETEVDGVTEVREFDKVALCHGYQTRAKQPIFEGQDKFEGVIMHSQQYRSPEQFKDKNVLVLGLHSTSGDIIPNLAPHAAKLFVSHRRGAFPFRRLNKDGLPADLVITWRRRQLSFAMNRYIPRLTRWLGNFAAKLMVRKQFGKLDPKFGLEPWPNLFLTLPGSWDDVYTLMKEGRVDNLKGLNKFLGPRTVEMSDGRILDDIDAVIMCTGYQADWSPTPFVETSKPRSHGYDGPPIHRLFMNLFPPQYADSCIMLCYSAFGKSNGFSFSDVTSMAVSRIWRGLEKLPSREAMEAQIDRNQEWVAGRWSLDHTIDVSAVKTYEFQPWLHRVAGTGMENLGWGWKGWLFWLRDKKMSNLMNDGVETAHAYRFFETGKRKTWPGAREEIIRQNEVIQGLRVKKD